MQVTHMLNRDKLKVSIWRGILGYNYLILIRTSRIQNSF